MDEGAGPWRDSVDLLLLVILAGAGVLYGLSDTENNIKYLQTDCNKCMRQRY